MPLNLNPRRAPAPIPNSRTITVITWNTTGSDDPQKLEQVAELVWGSPARNAFADVVVCQEFSQTFQNYPRDYKQLCAALKRNNWEVDHTDDEGLNSSSHRSYFTVWNTRRLNLRRAAVFITDLTAPVVVPPPPPQAWRPQRQRNPVNRFQAGALDMVNNPPLGFEFTTWIPGPAGPLPLALYTWHTTQSPMPLERVRRLPLPGGQGAGPGPVAIGIMTSRARIAVEMQQAINSAGVFVLAGDLNVSSSMLRQAYIDVWGQRRIVFPPALGFRTISVGGHKGWDHVIAGFGPGPQMVKALPGVKLGDHRPLQADITV